MTAKLLEWKGFSKDVRISPWALSLALLIGSAVWLVAAGACYAASGSKDGWSGTPLFWMLTLIVTPSICFAFGVVLVNARLESRLSWFDWCALVAAFLPVTLGSFLAALSVKVMFWASFRETSIGLRVFGTLTCTALVLIAGAMIWKSARDYLSGKQADEAV